MDSFSREPSADDDDVRAASQRSGARDSLLLIARVRTADEGSDHEVRVRNLSEGGMMLEWRRVLDIGTPLVLDLRGIGEVGGKVAWCAEGRMGVSLDEPIDPKKARKPVGGGGQTPPYVKPILSHRLR